MPQKGIVINGIYRHYKGPLYKVIMIGKHSETEEDLVIYYAVLKPQDIWVRPLTMFEEDAIIEGKTMKRFTFVEKQD